LSTPRSGKAQSNLKDDDSSVRRSPRSPQKPALVALNATFKSESTPVGRSTRTSRRSVVESEATKEQRDVEFAETAPVTPDRLTNGSSMTRSARKQHTTVR